jgi:hypothetical protein
MTWTVRISHEEGSTGSYNLGAYGIWMTYPDKDTLRAGKTVEIPGYIMYPDI